MSQHGERRRALRRATESIVAIADAYEAVVATAELLGGGRPPRVVYCIDDSELCEFLVPKSLSGQGDRYPTALDIAILYLFESGPRPLYLHPFYVDEFTTVYTSWYDRLIRVSQLTEELVKRVVQDRASQATDLEFIKASLHKVLALVYRNGESFRQYHRMLKDEGIQVLSFEVLGIPGDVVPVDRDDAAVWYKYLNDCEPSPDKRPANLVDSHVLSSIWEMNSSVGSDTVVVLVSHSPKLRHAVRARTDGSAFSFTKRGVPLLQPPETALVRHYNFGSASAEHTDDSRILGTLVELRDKYAAQKKMFQELEEALAGHGRLEPSEYDAALRRVDECVAWFQSTLTQWANVAIAGREAGENDDAGSHVRKVLKALDICIDPTELRRESQVLLNQLRMVQSEMWYAFPPAPLDFTFLDGERSLVPERRIRSGYSYQFMSDHLSRKVASIQRRVMDGELTEARLRIIQANSFGHNSGDPDECLFMAFLCNLANKWPQAYDASLRGLEALGWTEGGGFAQRRDEAWRGRCIELGVSYVYALRQWAVENYQFPTFVEKQLDHAANCAKGLRDSGLAGNSTELDARLAREFAVIFMLAYDRGLRLGAIDDSPAQDNIQRNGLLDLGIEYARIALRNAKDDDLKTFCENNLLYGLSHRNDPQEIDERGELARSLGESSYADEAHFLDTLAWHCCKLAEIGIDTEANLARSVDLIEAASKLALEDNDSNYAVVLIGEHRKHIQSQGKAARDFDA